jgi:hypothetical protein
MIEHTPPLHYNLQGPPESEVGVLSSDKRETVSLEDQG